MRLALYHPWIYLRGGAERVLAELSRRSAHDWVFFTHHFEPESTFPELAEAEIVPLRPAISVRRSMAPLAAAAAVIATSRLPDAGASALLVSSEGLGDFILARNRLPAVGYCHTPLKILHDPVTRRRLSAASPMKAVALGGLGPVFSAADRRLWRRYRYVFANSGEVRTRLQRAGLGPSGGIEVLHPGVDIQRFAGAGATTVRQRTFVVPGRIMWQKNVELAVDAFAEARRRGLTAELVVAGAVDAKSERYLADLRSRADGQPVRFETDVSDERLADLLASCIAAVHPAPSEDFGITPLEAMAAGAPVLAVDAGGTRETIVDGKTGWLVPADPTRFADVLLDAAAAYDRGELDVMRSAARARAAEFTWERFVERIDDVMEAVATGSPPPAP